jgi:hypothetical protein
MRLTNIEGLRFQLWDAIEQAKEMERKQQGYSEEEVIELLNRREDYTSQAPKTDWFSINKWFEQFKKK